MSEALFPVLHVLVGLPRAGKTTLANYVSKALGIPVVNLDEIRLKLFDTVFDPRYEPAVLRAGYSAIHKNFFIDGHSAVILDATNTTKARRDAFRSGVWVCHYHLVGTPPEVCIQRAHETGKSGLVPVIEEKHLNYESPLDDPSQGVKGLEKVFTVDMAAFEKDPTSMLGQFKQTITVKEARRDLGLTEFMELPYGDKETMTELVNLSADLQFERDFVNVWTNPGKEPNPATMDWFDQDFDEVGRNWPIQPPDNVTNELTVTPAFPFTVINPESVETSSVSEEWLQQWGIVAQFQPSSPSTDTKIGRGLLNPVFEYYEVLPHQETTMQTEETKPLLNLYVVRPFSNAAVIAKDHKVRRGTPYIDLEALYGTWAKPEYIQKHPMSFDSCDGTTAEIFMRYLFAIGEKEIDIVLPVNHTAWVKWFVDAAVSYGASTNVMVVESDLHQSKQNAIKFLKDHGVEMDQERVSEWCCGALLTTDEIIEASLDPVTAFGPDITTPKSNRMKLFEALKDYDSAWLDLDLYMAARQ